jgi:O-antigen/teichoic acid export membrane protein
MRRLFRRVASIDRALEGSLVIAQLLGAGTGVLLARAVGPTGKGEVATLALWGQLIGWVASFSLEKAIIVLTKREHVALRRQVALVTSRRLVTIFSLPAMVLALLLGRYLFSGWYLPVVLALLTAATAQMELVGGWILALGERPLYLLWRLAQPALYLSIVGGTAVLRLGGVLTDRHALVLIVVGVLTSVAAPIFLRYLPSLSADGGRFSWRAARHLLRYGLAAETANVLTYLNGQLDLLTLTLIAGSNVVGIYAVGASVSQAVVLFGTAAVVRGLRVSAEG